MVSLCNIAISAFLGTFAVYVVGANSSMHATGTQYGFLLTAAGVGSLVGSPATGWASARFSRGLLLGTAIVCTAIFIGVPSLSTRYAVVMGALTIGGFGVAMWNVLTVSFRQRITPDHLLGRINGFYRLVTWGTIPLGTLVGGAIGELIGIRPMYAAMAALTLLSLAGLQVVNTKNMHTAEDEAAKHEPGQTD